jgi:hypothetical protein
LPLPALPATKPSPSAAVPVTSAAPAGGPPKSRPAAISVPAALNRNFLFI